MPTPSTEPVAFATPSPARRGGVLAVLQLARWPNALIAGAAVLLGAAWAGRVTPASWLAAVAALALTTLVNTVHDIHDVAIDAVAHPERPLPSGALSRDAARGVAGVTAAIGILASAAASAALGALSCVVVAAMRWYSASLKRRSGLAGNLLVALLASLPSSTGPRARGAPAGGSSWSPSPRRCTSRARSRRTWTTPRATRPRAARSPSSPARA